MYWFVHEQVDDEADGVLLDSYQISLFSVSLFCIDRYYQFIASSSSFFQHDNPIYTTLVSQLHVDIVPVTRYR